jgi:hypothetical protein
MHLNCAELNVTTAPTAYDVPGCQLGIDCANAETKATQKRQTLKANRRFKDPSQKRSEDCAENYINETF